MPKLTTRALITAKVEGLATEGVDANPSALNNAVLISALTVTPQSEEIDRNIITNSISPRGHVVGMRWMELSFTTELRGRSIAVFDDTDANRLRQDPLLRACGFSPTYAASSSSVVYTPTSSNLQTCTIYANLDGMLHKLRGCRGNVNTIMETGQFGRQEWTFTGVYDKLTNATTGGIVDLAISPPTFQDFSMFPAPVMKSATCSIHTSTAFALQAVSINMNNQVATRPDMNSDNGIIGTILGSRNPQGTANPELVTRGANVLTDWWQRWQDGVTGAITVTIGATNGNTVIVNVPNSKFRNPSYGDRNGVVIMDLPFSCVANSDAADDEVTFTYK